MLCLSNLPRIPSPAILWKPYGTSVQRVFRAPQAGIVLFWSPLELGERPNRSLGRFDLSYHPGPLPLQGRCELFGRFW